RDSSQVPTPNSQPSRIGSWPVGSWELTPATHKPSRRDFLKLGGGAALASLAAGCAAHTRYLDLPRRSFARVLVAADRIIRTVVGLRPFRPSGFVVRTEKLDDKTIVHNYGHGGGGMTMSWGTSHLAVEQALGTGEKSAAVLGCGGVGLATARLLQRRGFTVTI